MPIDLEKEIIEIKMTLVEIKSSLRDITVLGESYDDLEYRMRKLENRASYMVGLGAAVSFFIATIISVVALLLGR